MFGAWRMLGQSTCPKPSIEVGASADRAQSAPEPEAHNTRRAQDNQLFSRADATYFSSAGRLAGRCLCCPAKKSIPCGACQPSAFQRARSAGPGATACADTCAGRPYRSGARQPAGHPARPELGCREPAIRPRRRGHRGTAACAASRPAAASGPEPDAADQGRPANAAGA